MKDKADKALPAKTDETVDAFKGYSMEELRYQRAMMALRKEFCKAKVMESVRELRPKREREGAGKSSSKFALAAQIASKVFSNLNTIDYVLMGISLFGTARKGFRLLRGKRK